MLFIKNSQMMFKIFLSDSSKQSKTETVRAPKGEMDFILVSAHNKWFVFLP